MRSSIQNVDTEGEPRTLINPTAIGKIVASVKKRSADVVEKTASLQSPPLDREILIEDEYKSSQGNTSPSFI